MRLRGGHWFSNFFSLLDEINWSRGKIPVIHTCSWGFCILNSMANDTKLDEISRGVSSSMLFVPQEIIAHLTESGRYKRPTLQRTFSMWSPLMPQLITFSGLRRFHISGYLESSATRLSPKMIASAWLLIIFSIWWRWRE